LGAALAVMGALMVFALASGDESVAGCSYNEKQRDEQPFWSPAGDQIRFLRILRGCFAPRVFMRVAATGGAAWPTRHGEMGVFSPDGTKVAFGSTSGIQVTDPDEGTVRRLTNGSDHDPAWSPDGSLLAFVRDVPGKARRDVFLVAADGSHAVDVTNETGAEEEPLFSPDGNWVSALTGPGYVRVGLELIRADGSDRVAVPLRPYDVAWSPDSHALAVVGGPKTYSDLYLVGLDGSVTQLTQTPGNETEPRWAPDGTLAVGSADASGQLLHFTAAGTPIPWNGEIRSNGRDYRWSPDGRTLAWVAPTGALVMAAADGSSARIAPGFTVESPLSWAPDSRHIAVSARRPPCMTRPEIAIVDVATLALTPLTNSCEIVGTDGADVLTGTYDDDVIRGLAGDDRISADDGYDTVEGGDGNDRIDGGSYPDHVDGGPGDDVVIGGGGLDVLTGGPGRDVLVGDWAKDLVYARDGERDSVRCGDQIDIVYADVVDSVARDCDVVLRTTADDYIRGTYGADTIDSGPGNDYVLAGSGNDHVDGGTGNDFLVGDWGDDRVIGGPGHDRLLGGPGADVLDARDGRRDLVDCGGREDTALVDRYDVVASNCERVRRTA
jgi:Tol biopolymer transport system component